jgi:serine phosphatase RsbU (regulator of sigma subunit)
MPKAFFDQYTRDLSADDFHRLFTRDTPEAYRYFTRTLDLDKLDNLPWYRKWPIKARLVFTAFAMRLSPARRALYGLAILSAILGLLMLYAGVHPVKLLLFPLTVHLPLPTWAPGTLWLFVAFVTVNLLILMEVADRLSLKSDLEIARDIQLAMLPGGIRTVGDVTISGVTRPANTVGGDFYDVLARPDGRLVLALGDVAGKGSPAALLMALLLASLRTLVEEDLDTASMVARLNVQVHRHSPRSRFITLFYALYDPRDGRLEYVNAGHLPPLIRRRDGRLERIGAEGNGLALGMFDHATYSTQQATIEPGDLLVLYSDGITEAENAAGRSFEDAGLDDVVRTHAAEDPQAIGRAILTAVEKYAAHAKLQDDLTALIMKRA